MLQTSVQILAHFSLSPMLQTSPYILTHFPYAQCYGLHYSYWPITTNWPNKLGKPVRDRQTGEQLTWNAALFHRVPFMVL